MHVQQAAAHGDQGVVLVHARREGIHIRRVINATSGHADIGLLRLPAHRLDQPVLGFRPRSVDDLRAVMNLADTSTSPAKSRAAEPYDTGNTSNAPRLRPPPDCASMR